MNCRGAHLYSNTPSDFDFKLNQISQPLSEPELVARLRQTDIVFPAIHGTFGEDGGVQAFLEANGIPFIGSGSVACQQAFDKHRANRTLAEHGFTTWPSLLLTAAMVGGRARLAAFMGGNSSDKWVVKPAGSGSSIGVKVVTSADDISRSRPALV